ncbi:hypothetical protein ABT381_03770 [Streptomyces sp. NPDC000151]|uniref:hypothetical protein n=1 Tax=Streptomyces sp. NPDC000151 TaxID=3154244 RepID=UPI0033169CAC
MTALTAVRPPPHSPAERRPPRTVPWLVLVAVGYAALQLALAVPHLGLGWDETVYVSQVDPRNPAAWFSAPRSRGISLLAAPLLAVSGSTLALRVFLALLSAAALYAAFAVWRPLLGAHRTALAALLFGSLWITVLYGPQAMPNLWVALATVAAVGWFLRATSPVASRRCTLVGLAAAVAAATLFRMPDGAWLALSLLVAWAVVPGWRRRPAPALALVAGAALGSAEWVVEAYARWGGIGARLHVSSATEGGMGAHWAGGYALRSLNGPLLCRPCHPGPPPHPALTLWWLALPPLAAIACAVALRTPRPSTTLLPVACAAAVSVQYLLLIDYSAPRFLLPTYALLSLPIAALAARTIGAIHHAPARVLVAALLTALFAAHLAGQYAVLRHNADDARITAARYGTAADRLHALGLRPPCLITGKHALPVAYYAGCASAETVGNNRSTTTHALLRRATHEPTAALRPTGHAPPHYAHGWTAHRLRGTGWTAYLPQPGQ